MILPCIDLMEGKVTQLVQGQTKAIQLDDYRETLDRFAPFPLIHVIDLDAAMGKGENHALLELIARERRCRVGGGVRTIEAARHLIDLGAEQVIVGTAALHANGLNEAFLLDVGEAIGRERICLALDSRGGRIVVKGWQEALPLSPAEMAKAAEPFAEAILCTFVDREGTLQGTDPELYLALRAATDRRIIAAGGIGSLDEVKLLLSLGVDVALGMSIYTGKIDLADLLNLSDSKA